MEYLKKKNNCSAEKETALQNSFVLLNYFKLFQNLTKVHVEKIENLLEGIS